MLGHVSLRLAYLAVLRVFGWLMVLHRWKWEDVRRRFTGHTGRWREPSADGIALFDMATVPVTRCHYRGNKIPNGPQLRLTAEAVESPVLGDGYAGFGVRHGETDRWPYRHRAPCRLDGRTYTGPLQVGAGVDGSCWHSVRCDPGGMVWGPVGGRYCLHGPDCPCGGGVPPVP